MKKVAISACLLGEFCRYDGQTKANSDVIKAFEQYEVLPFCPEAPVLGTPRERISVVQVGNDYRVITDETNKDVTDLLVKQTQMFIEQHSDLDLIVLKSKSPSCGLGTTPILNEQKKLTCKGDGIAASMLKRAYPKIKIVDENGF